METEDYLSLRLDDFLDRLAAGGRAPGGGSAAALAVAFAAGLVAMVARCSRDTWDDASGVAAQALTISDRRAARPDRRPGVGGGRGRAPRGGHRGPGREAGLRARAELERAAAVPLEIAELGADAASLAALVGEYCDGSFRADAAAAAALASGGASAAAHLVEVNLGVREVTSGWRAREPASWPPPRPLNGRSRPSMTGG